MDHVDIRPSRVGFARLLGDNIDHIVRKYDIILGRQNKNKPVDVVLGDTMSVSRQHARIRYDFEKKCFVIDVMGKNGVVLNGTLLEAGKTSVPLKSQSLLQIGADVTFYFLLPKRLSLVFNEPGQKRERDVVMVSGNVETQPTKQARIDEMLKSRPQPVPDHPLEGHAHPAGPQDVLPQSTQSALRELLWNQINSGASDGMQPEQQHLPHPPSWN